MQDLESLNERLSEDNNLLQDRETTLNDKKDELLIKIARRIKSDKKKILKLYEKNAKISEKNAELLLKHDSQSKKINDFGTLITKINDLDAFNENLEKIIAIQQKWIENLLSIKKESAEFNALKTERLRVESEMLKTNEQIETKNSELLSLKHKMFSISIEINKMNKINEEKISNKYVSRSASGINVPLYLKNFQMVNPPKMFSIDGFEKELPPLKKIYKSENIKYSSAKVLAKGKVPVKEIKVHEQKIFSMTASAKDPYILTFSLDKTFKCLDIIEKTFINLPHRIHWDHKYLNGDFSPDRQHIACCSTGDTIEIFTLKPGKFKSSLKAQKYVVNDIKYLNKDALVSCSEDSCLKLWDINRGSEFICFRTGSKGKTLGVCVNNESCFLSGHYDGKLRIWDSRQFKIVKELKLFENNGVKSVKMAESGDFSVALGANSNELKLIDLRAMKFIEVESQELIGNNNLNSVALWCYESFILGGGDKGELVVLDSFKKKQLEQL